MPTATKSLASQAAAALAFSHPYSNQVFVSSKTKIISTAKKQSKRELYSKKKKP
jgi:hypothetical protein